jgi:putative ABC transport system permease protein
VLAALIGTAVAYLAVVAFSWHVLLSGPVSIFPVPDLLIVLLGLPLLATAVGWVFAGRQPSAIDRQPLE